MESTAHTVIEPSGTESPQPLPPLPVHDYVELGKVASLYCHICDDWTWDRFDEVFTEDATFDGGDIGLGLLIGLDAIKARFASWQQPIAHTSTDLYVLRCDETGVRLRSKWLVLVASNRMVAGEYRDVATLTVAGWRLRERVANVYRRPRRTFH
jgi:hypothetical protein